jgi:peptidoglycan/LPS O-acetylase OafA/YrhL
MKSLDKESSARTSAMDGLRAFAAFSVVIFHVLYQPHYMEGKGELYKSVVISGSSMVQVFFVISGYFIFESIKSISNGFQNPHLVFFLKRFFRIIPVWILVLTIMLVKGEISWPGYFANLVFYFGDMRTGSPLYTFVPGWSLQVEVLFYLLCALFLKQVSALKLTRIILLWILAVCTSIIWSDYANSQSIGIELKTSFVLANLSYFVSGFAIASAAPSFSTKKTFFRRSLFLGVEIFAVIAFLLTAMINLKIGSALHVTAPLLVFAVVYPGSFLGAALSNRLLAKAGLISYGVYLLQLQGMAYSGRWFNPSGRFQEAMGAVAVTIVFAAIAFFTVERPAQRLCSYLILKFKK